jgi:hypothetical protein
LTEFELYKARTTLESSIKQKGGYFQNENIDEILEQLNPTASKITLPTEIVNDTSLFSIKEPMIKFADGEIYEGGWNLKNQRNGYGISINKEGNVFKGLWENDNFGKYGAFIENNGNYYIGELENGKAKGNGEMLINNKMKYKGEFNDDLPYGKGILENYRDNSIYSGNVINGVKEGYGELKFEDGTIYKGEFKDDKYYDGNIYYPDGTYYSGKFDNNLFDGEGFLEGCNKHSYNGSFKKGKFHGYGEFKWIAGGFYKEEYHGEYCNGKKEGQGKFIFNNKDNSFEGSWKSGLPNGEGVFDTKNRKYYCIWRSGIFTQLLKYEEKEGCEEENVEFNFKTPIEDIIIPDQIGISLVSNFSYRSVLINGSEEML